MPAVAPRTLTLTPEDYFAWGTTQEVRHEYHNGAVFPMPGGSSAHAEIIVNVTVALVLALRETECTVRSEAMRVQVSESHYVYPDLTVTRGPAEFRTGARTTLLNPVLAVGVLSPSTRSYDIGEKLALYRGVPSLQEVLFVDSARREAETVRRTPGGWVFGGPVAEGEVRLESVGVGLDLGEVYRGVEGLG